MIMAKPEDRPFILSRRLKEFVSPTIQKKEIRAFRVEKGRKFNLDPLNTIIKATKLWMRSFNLKSRVLKFQFENFHKPHLIIHFASSLNPYVKLYNYIEQTIKRNLKTIKQNAKTKKENF